MPVINLPIECDTFSKIKSACKLIRDIALSIVMIILTIIMDLVNVLLICAISELYIIGQGSNIHWIAIIALIIIPASIFMTCVVFERMCELWKIKFICRYNDTL